VGDKPPVCDVHQVQIEGMTPHGFSRTIVLVIDPLYAHRSRIGIVNQSSWRTPVVYQKQPTAWYPIVDAHPGCRMRNTVISDL